MTSQCLIKQSLDRGWQFKKASDHDSRYLPVSQFPTNIHLDLFENGSIPDPHVGKNEIDIQWVDETAWTYGTTFHCPSFTSPMKATLAFDGLDTFATVQLNGKIILKSDNMFIPYRVDVTDYVYADDDNDLIITFESASQQGWKRIKEHPNHRYIASNGDDSRLPVRKAQYHWGWDWGPKYVTCGPWRPITLELYTSRISDLVVDSEVDETLDAATITVDATMDGKASKFCCEVRHHPSDELVETYESELDLNETEKRASFCIKNPRLWWPAHVGEGDPNLYTVIATIFDDNCEKLDSITKNIGLRRLELVQQQFEDEPGKSFFFKINNRSVFCGGSNWIPADNFIPRITDDKYQKWIKTAIEGNHNMIRVWGGGIYEQDAFYDACDEQGLLVWQDFMFACGNYPCWPEFVESIELEATVNVKRLRHHPSIVIWAGNNEDYQIAESEGLDYDPNDNDPASWLKTNFPARYIYEKLLANVCRDWTPRTPYHPGSPWGGKNSADPTVGDLHQWNVWHGTQEKYQNWGNLVGRFVSEFGMQGFPNIKTIDALLPKGQSDPDRYPQSSTLDFHNKATGHERRLALYLVENIRYSHSPLEYYIYCTQLMQAECLSTAYRVWKRQWKGPEKEYCSGALVWQLNDVWPGTSWSISDYYGRKKLAYYAIKREMAKYSIGIARLEPKESSTDPEHHLKAGGGIDLDVWACNFEKERTVSVILKAWDIESGVETYSRTLVDSTKLPENASTEIARLQIPLEKGAEGSTLVAAYLFDGDHLLARYVDWPQPLKYVHMKEPKQLKISIAEDAESVDIESEVPIKGLALACEDAAVEFDDNCIDIVPGQSVRVLLEGATSQTVIKAEYYHGW